MSEWGTTVPMEGMPQYVATACSAITYVTDPDVWPQFVAYMTEHHPEAINPAVTPKREQLARHAADLLLAAGYGRGN